MQKFQDKLRKVPEEGDGVEELEDSASEPSVSDDDEAGSQVSRESEKPGEEMKAQGRESKEPKAAPAIEVGDVESEGGSGGEMANGHEEGVEAAKSKRTNEESELEPAPKQMKPKKSKRMAAQVKREEKHYEFSPRTESLLAHFVLQQRLKMRKNERAGRSHSESQRPARPGDAAQKLEQVMGILRECFDQSKEDEQIKEIDSQKKEMREYNEQVNTTVTQLQENLVLFDPAAHQKDQLRRGDSKFDPEEIMKEYIRSEHENFENFFQPKPELEDIVEKLEHTQFVRKLLRGRCGWNIQEQIWKPDKGVPISKEVERFLLLNYKDF